VPIGGCCIGRWSCARNVSGTRTAGDEGPLLSSDEVTSLITGMFFATSGWFPLTPPRTENAFAPTPSPGHKPNFLPLPVF